MAAVVFVHVSVQRVRAAVSVTVIVLDTYHDKYILQLVSVILWNRWFTLQSQLLSFVTLS